MALYRIGVTEAGDAGVDLSWEEKLDDVDAAVLVTKCVSPDFFDAALRHKDIISLGVPQGKQIGVILHELLEEVILDTLPNEHDVLLRKAVELIERT